MKNRWLKAKQTEGVSPVIAVILMVAITVVLAALLYVLVTGMIPPGGDAPKGALTFNQEGTYNGGKNYTGHLVSLSEEVLFTDVSMTILMNGTGAASAGNDAAFI